jgi:hypothetical protein
MTAILPVNPQPDIDKVFNRIELNIIEGKYNPCEVDDVQFVLTHTNIKIIKRIVETMLEFSEVIVFQYDSANPTNLYIQSIDFCGHINTLFTVANAVLNAHPIQKNIVMAKTYTYKFLTQLRKLKKGAATLYCMQDGSVKIVSGHTVVYHTPPVIIDHIQYPPIQRMLETIGRYQSQQFPISGDELSQTILNNCLGDGIANISIDKDKVFHIQSQDEVGTVTTSKKLTSNVTDLQVGITTKVYIKYLKALCVLLTTMDRIDVCVDHDGLILTGDITDTIKTAIIVQ